MWKKLKLIMQNILAFFKATMKNDMSVNAHVHGVLLWKATIIGHAQDADGKNKNKNRVPEA